MCGSGRCLGPGWFLAWSHSLSQGSRFPLRRAPSRARKNGLVMNVKLLFCNNIDLLQNLAIGVGLLLGLLLGIHNLLLWSTLITCWTKHLSYDSQTLKKYTDDTFEKNKCFSIVWFLFKKLTWGTHRWTYEMYCPRINFEPIKIIVYNCNPV